MRVRELVTPAPIHLAETLSPLTGVMGDPCLRRQAAEVAIGARTPEGPGSILVRPEAGVGRVRAEAWGRGARWLLDGLPELVGARDDRAASFAPTHPWLVEVWRRHPGLRVPATRRVLDLLVPTILGQKVTGVESAKAWKGLVRTFGEPGPGPVGVWVPPAAATLADLGYQELHRFGVERRRAETIRRVAAIAPRLERWADEDPAQLVRALSAQRDIGPWTMGLVRYAVLGDADAVPTGDYHLPNSVAWNLAGEARGDDTRMLELLAPFAGDRGRVVRLVALHGATAPKRGPRMPVRSFARF